MRIAFTWDDGAPEDEKLFELHEKYEIPGLFFVPNFNIEMREVITENQIIQASKSHYISFGGHTQSHCYLDSIPISEAEEEIINNKKWLEGLTCEEVKHFCFPGGKYNKELLAVAKRHYQTVRTADTMNFRKPVDKICKPSLHIYPRGVKSLIYNSLRHGNIATAFLSAYNYHMSYFDLIKKIIEYHSSENSYILIWGHSWEIEELSVWGEVESLFKHLKDRYASNVCSYESFVMGE